MRKKSRGNDIVYTPDTLSHRIVQRFLPQIKGTILEPCYGGGSFLRAFERNNLHKVVKTEETEGTDFFCFWDKVDWIITNPPWSIYTAWSKHSFNIADNIVFLVLVMHVFYERRIKDMREAGFGIKEILTCDTPPDTPDSPWPPNGAQLGVIHLSRGWGGDISFGEL